MGVRGWMCIAHANTIIKRVYSLKCHFLSVNLMEHLTGAKETPDGALSFIFFHFLLTTKRSKTFLLTPIQTFMAFGMTTQIGLTRRDVRERGGRGAGLSMSWRKTNCVRPVVLTPLTAFSQMTIRWINNLFWKYPYQVAQKVYPLA